MKHFYVTMETTLGNLRFELSNETPGHRDNFVKLVREGYYDSLLFHRVISKFMIQGGDPNSRNAGPNERLGMGGPGYTIPAEFRENLIHIKGAIAAARTGDQMNPQKASSGSQFYIVQGDNVNDMLLGRVEMMKNFKYTDEQRKLYAERGGTPHLDRDYTVFGMLVDGFDVLDKIAAVQKAPGDRPLEDVRILKATVSEE